MKNLAIFTVLLSIFILSACYPYKNNPYRYPVYKKNKSLPKTTASSNKVVNTQEAPTQADASEQQEQVYADSGNSAETIPSMPENTAPQNRIHRMVAESRLELISTGMSPEYVDQHFQVVDMIDEEHEKKVIWKYTIGEYEIIVTDPVSWIADEREEILYTHGIKQELGTTRNIELVIPKKQALEIMHECLGEHKEITFAFTAREVPGNAIPWMISKSENNDGTWNVAYINLENGTCEKETGGAMPLMLED
jgi:hypothetical protein